MTEISERKLKILHLMEIFKEHTDENHGLTMAQIIALLKERGIPAERKGIYRDIESLKEFGMDIEQCRGKEITYHLMSREFEQTEVKLLVDAVQSSKFITHKKSNLLIKKIGSLLSKHEAKELQRQVFVANRIKTMNESIYYVVDDIHKAISADKKIRFQYYEWNEKKEKQLRHDGMIYEVSPWALTWDDENYYMIAYDDKSEIIKHYRVDKMVRLTISDESRLGKEFFKNFDMGLYSKKTFGMYGGRDEQVTLICHNDMAGIIIDRFGQDIIMQKFGDDSFKITVKVAVSPLFLTWLMNFGERIKILSPQAVVEEYIKMAKKALAVYED